MKIQIYFSSAVYSINIHSCVKAKHRKKNNVSFSVAYLEIEETEKSQDNFTSWQTLTPWNLLVCF